MKKDIKYFIHLYIGSEVFGTYSDASGSKGILTGVTNGGHECEIQFILEDGINVEEDPEWNDSNEVKILLRPLNDMTEEEAWEFVGGKSDLYEDVRITKLDKTGIEISYTIDAGEEGQYPQVHRVAFAAFMPKEFIWLLSKGFDLFGLIEAGLAIDKSKLPVE